jgi:hypothetical protein
VAEHQARSETSVGQQAVRMVALLAMWAVAHGATAVALFSIGQFVPLASNVELYMLPIGLGAVQAILLRKSLRWWMLAWVPASLLGLFLSFFGIWWFLLCIGLGMGTTQAMVLSAARVRRSWLWPFSSGAGWIIGMFVGHPLSQQLSALVGQEWLEMAAVYGVTTFIYGFFVGANAAVLKRSERLDQPKT